MKICVIPTGAFGANCYLVWDEAGNAVVADPGADADVILKNLQKNGLTPRAYLLTHGHFDHIAAVCEMAKAAPAPVFLSEADAAWAFSSMNAYPPYAAQTLPPADMDTDLHDGRVLEFGALKITVIATPGHTPGGVCYFFEDDRMVLSGDTLFHGSVGRTDLPGGDWAVLAKSLRKLVVLDDGVRVLPGHGPATTIRDERRNNPYINGDI